MHLGTERNYLLRLGIVEHQRAITRTQQQTVGQQFEEIEAQLLTGLHLGFLFKRLAIDDQQIVGAHHQDIIGAINKAVAPRLIGGRSVKLRQEDMMLLVVHQQVHTIIHKYAALTVHQ